jgi:2-polyprenyl-6-methoxyphenol hydroxylase-like FAD-dependent oxidoreductase
MTDILNRPRGSTQTGAADPIVRHADIAIVGGGLAGSTAAAMLARQAFRVVLIDPHTVYPPDLRCEKLDGPQIAVFRRTGLADLVLPSCTRYPGFWVGRFGHVIDKRSEVQYGTLYDSLVNSVRAAIPDEAVFIAAKVTAIDNSSEIQKLALSSGETVCARLVVLANGLNSGLRSSLGIVREDVSKSHSVTLAFNMKPVGRHSFEFPALVYAAERARDRIAYITLFPIGETTRANLMTYRGIDDPWLRDMRERPDAALQSMLPRLGRVIGAAEVVGPVRIRPADLYVSRRHLQPGVVLVGDAFASSCPAAGTGTGKVFTDVERLCNVHVPHWMKTEGMGIDKIGAFYADPEKVACDRHSFEKAFDLRSLSTDGSASWRAQRWSRFLARVAIGSTRQVLTRMRTAA